MSIDILYCDIYAIRPVREDLRPRRQEKIAAEVAKAKRSSHYEDLASQYLVTPVAAETIGSWGPLSLKFIKELGGRIALSNGEPRSTNYLLQSLGMAIQRGNAMSIVGTLPSQRKLDEIYYL